MPMFKVQGGSKVEEPMLLPQRNPFFQGSARGLGGRVR